MPRDKRKDNASVRKRYRPDHDGTHRLQFEHNKKIIFATQTVCALCGKPVDFSLKYPNPWSATIDHIIPIDKGGHPSDLENMQLAHFRCNRLKSDKIQDDSKQRMKKNNDVVVITNRMLPQSIDWEKYRS